MKFTIAVLLGALLMVLVSAEERSDCARCIMKQRPVCGRDSQGHMQTFANSCTLRRENCMHNSDFVQVRKGNC